MKRNMKIIQINGVSGILLTVFVVSCLIAGFVAFPALLCMLLWNYIAGLSQSINSINYLGGILLWSMAVILLLIYNKHKSFISLATPKELSKDELQQVLTKIQTKEYMHIPSELSHLTSDDNFINSEEKEEVEKSKE